MITVLIADDEWIEREGIRSVLEMSPYPFKIHMAQNGREALKYLKTEPVDLLFTDVKMPFMDGITLMQEIRKQNTELRIIVFSAFAEFQYAQSAMEYQAMHYLLKPVDPEKLLEMVNQLAEEIVQEQKEKSILHVPAMNEMWEFLAKNGKMPQYCENLFRVYGAYELVLLDVQEEKDTLISRLYEVLENRWESPDLLVTVSEGLLLLLLHEELSRRKIEKMRIFLEENKAEHACIVYGKTVNSEETFRMAYQEMNQKVQIHFFEEGNQVFCLQGDEERPKEAEKAAAHIQEEIERGIKEKNYAYVLETLEVLKKELRNHVQDSQIYVKYVYADIVKKISEKDKTDTSDFKKILVSIFDESSLNGIHRLVFEWLQEIVNAGKETEQEREQKKVIQGIKRKIQREYQNELSLSGFADEVHLTPAYLSYLFKKETGMSLIKYITMIRMEKAKELLANTNNKIADIAKQVGYTNYSYFNIAFKNNVGVSPGTYREENSQ